MDDCPAPCLACLSEANIGAWEGAGYPPVNDPEGRHIGDGREGIGEVIDMHVHLFAEPLFDAIWRWFDKHLWPVRYRLYTPEVIAYLRARGVSHMIALHYAHKPGIARGMNRYLAAVCAQNPDVTGLATVFPGEPGAADILREAFALGLRGVKLHCHVQCFAPDSATMDTVYQECIRHDLPLVIHAGREPSSKAYKCDAHALCAASRMEAVLRAYPALRVCVPHLGADEFGAYEQLMEGHPNLWLDTTMMVADYFRVEMPMRMLAAFPERVMYGSDFPNLPYAWDRELKHIWGYGLRPEDLGRILSRNARAFFRIGG